MSSGAVGFASSEFETVLQRRSRAWFKYRRPPLSQLNIVPRLGDCFTAASSVVLFAPGMGQR